MPGVWAGADLAFAKLALALGVAFGCAWVFTGLQTVLGRLRMMINVYGMRTCKLQSLQNLTAERLSKQH